MNERPGFLRMALETDCITGSCRPQLPGLEPAVRIVTITALHHAFIHPVMEGAIELLFGFQMATVAKLRLLLFHQKLALLGMVGRMAIDAAHVILQVRRPGKIAVLFPIGMAIQAARA